MAKSKLNFKRSIIDKLNVKGILSEDVTVITYTDDNDIEQDIKVSDLLNIFKNQFIDFSVQLKDDKDLDVVSTAEE